MHILRRLITILIVVALTEGIFLQYNPIPVKAATSIDVVAPSDFVFSNFSVGINEGASTTAGSVTLTDPTPTTVWHVTAIDEKTPDTGYLVSSSNVLDKLLYISKDGSTYNKTASEGITYNGSGVTSPVPIPSDIQGSYTITITFTAVVDVQ
jgi:hypothetical protein